MDKNAYMSTQHCGLTAPVASTTVYLLGAVHSTEITVEQINNNDIRHEAVCAMREGIS